MSPRGRRAVLPPPDHARVPALSPGSVVVRHLGEDGRAEASYDFGTLPIAPLLQRQLAEIFAARCGSSGTWRSVPTSQEAWVIVRAFAEFLLVQPRPPEAIEEIGPEIWAAWRLSRGSNSTGERQIRKLAGLLRSHPGLPAETVTLTHKRVAKQAAKEVAYSDAEFDQIKASVARVFRTALHRIRGNLQHLERWREGKFTRGTSDWLVGEALDYLMRTGDVPTYTSTDGRIRLTSRYHLALRENGGKGADSLSRLFLDSREALALQVLLIATYGWNATSVDELTVPTASPDLGRDAQTIYRVELIKRRRGPQHHFETRNLTDWGPGSPGRLLGQAIEATGPARKALAALGRPTDRLIVWRVRRHRGPGRSEPGDGFVLGVPTTNLSAAIQGLNDGASVNLRRLRKTVVVAHHRQPSQHNQDTHDQVYVVPDPRTREDAAPVIAEGVADALAQARNTFRARTSRTESDGTLDTATAGCGDYTHSPFSAAGAPCRASFLLCTACPNAVVAPRHLPRLAYLHQALGELRRVLPAQVWDHDWREHHARLGDLRSRPDFTATEWTDALERIGREDKDMIDQLLTRGFDA